MDINVKMTAEEFVEFLAWKEDKTKYTEMEKHLRTTPRMIAASLKHAIEPQAGPKAKFKIIDHEHLGDARDVAAEFLT